MNKTIFDIQNLTFSISGKKILHSLSIKIYDGDFLSIIGPNGSGKTTLMKCLIGINPVPDETIFFNGIPVEKISQREIAKRVSYVPQISERIFPFTAEEFLLLARYPHLSRFTSVTPEDKKKVAAAFELTRTTHLAKRNLDTLSGGEQQMILIAAAIAQGGKIILLDEPATFLDPKHEYDIYKTLKRIHGEAKKTIVSVTHNINNAILYSDKIAILKEGEIFYYGNPTEITEGKTLEKAYEKKFSFIIHPEKNCKIILPEIIK